MILQTFVDYEREEHIVQWRRASSKRKEVITDPYLFYYSYTAQAPETENPPNQPVPAPEPV